MKIAMFFAPAFVPLGKAFIKEMTKREPAIRFVALTTTRQVRDQLLRDASISFDAIECLEEQEEQWLARTDYTPEKMQHFEAIYGAKTIRDMIICDRQAGAGFVTCAEREDSTLAQKTRNPDGLNAYTLGMLDYTETFFKTHKPDALFAYVIASGPMLCFAKACEKQGVFFARLQHTRIENCTVMDTDIKGMLEPVWSAFNAGKKPSSDHKAKEWLKTFREKNREPDYMAILKTQSKKAMSARGILFGILKATARALLYDFIKKDKPLRANSGWQGIKQSITIPYKSWRLSQRKDYVKLNDLQQNAYIYFPLHVDPEASTMLLAPNFTNQISVIEAISKSMPPSMLLFVKEHPNMNGRRPSGFYDAIATLPHVRLIDPAITGRDALYHSKMMITITGTAGWEAVLLGKPGVILGDAHFRQFECLEHCTNLSVLDKAIQNSLAKIPLKDSEIERFLSLVFEESFSLPSSLAWASPNKDIEAKDWAVINAMADHFMTRYKARKKLSGSKAA